MRVIDGGHPIPHRLVHGILQRARTCGDRHHFGAQQLHACDVERLALRVHFPHVDPALETQQRRSSSRRDTMLAGARLRDHATLTHSLSEQRLTQHVIDLVRASVVQVLALQVHLGVAGVLGKAAGESHRCGAPGVIMLEPTKLAGERRVRLRVVERLFEFQQRGLQRLRNKLATVAAKVSLRVGK